MKKINKATEVREKLGLTQKQCGELFAGQTGQNANDVFGRWERTGNWPKPADKLFSAILTLKMCEEMKAPGASKALRIVLDMLQPDDG